MDFRSYLTNKTIKTNLTVGNNKVLTSLMTPTTLRPSIEVFKNTTKVKNSINEIKKLTFIHTTQEKVNTTKIAGNSAKKYDTRKASSNTIKKILDEESLVSRYLEEAKAELDATRTERVLKDSDELRNSIDKIISKREEVKDNVSSLYIIRNIAYENLLSSIIGNYYATKLINNIDAYKKARAVLKEIDSDNQDSKILQIIDELTNNLIVLDVTTVLDTQYKLIENIKKLAAELEAIFDSLKDDLGFKDLEIGEDGSLKGLGQVYSVSTNLFKGTIEFYKENDMGEKEKLPDDFNISEIKDEDDIKSSVELELLKDITIEDGTEANPYLIYNVSDFQRFLDSDYGVYYRLMSDINFTSGGRFLINSNLDGNGHTITLSGSFSRLDFTSGILKGSLNIVAKPSFSRFLLIPILKRINVLFGKTFSIDDSGSLNIYLDLSAYNNASRFSLALIDVNDFLSITTQGMTIEDSIDRVNFFFNYDGSYWDKNEYTVNKRLLDYEDDDGGKHLSGTTKNFNKTQIKKVTTLNFSSDGSATNSIIKKGTVISVSGTVFLDNGELAVKANDEAEDSVNRVYFYPSGTTFLCKVNNVMHSYEDDNGVTYNFYPFFDFNEVQMIRFDGSSPDEAAGALKMLSDMAMIIILKNLTIEELARLKEIKEQTEGEEAFLRDYDEILDRLASLKQSLIAESESLKQSLAVLLDNISGSIQTFQYIEQQRQAEDSSYNSDYTSNISGKFTDVFGLVSQILSLEGDADIDNIFENIEATSGILRQECVNLVLGLSESIVMLNKTIEDYLLLFDLTENYGNMFLDILETTASIVQKLHSLSSSGFKVMVYGPLRHFGGWRNGLTKYTNDGIFGLGQIYIGQEFGLNSIKSGIHSDDTLSVILKYLVNDSIIRSFKKDLYIGNFDKVDDIFFYEETLEKEYGVIVNIDANYEVLNPILTAKVQGLKVFNDIDLEDILSGTTASETVDANKQAYNLEIGNLLEMIFIKYLFSNNSEDVTLKITELFNIFDVSNKNFRNILVEYHFKKLVAKIISISEKNIDTEEVIFSKDQLVLLKKYNINTNELKDIIQKYVAVWMFKYYVYYEAGGSILHYIGEDGLLEYLYRHEVYIPAAQTKETAWQDIVSFIKDVWDKLVEIFT